MKTNFEKMKIQWMNKKLDKVEKLCRKLNLSYERSQPESYQLTIFFNEDGKVPKFIITGCPTLTGAGLFEFKCPPVGIHCYLKISDISKVILDSVHC